MGFSKDFIEKQMYYKSQSSFFIYLNGNELGKHYLDYDYDSMQLDSAFNLKLNLSFQGIGKNKKSMVNLQYYGRLNNLQFYFEPIITNYENSEKVLGTNYSRNGISGRVQESYLKITNPLYNIYFGRLPIKWGESLFGSIVQSGLYPSYDNALISFKLGKIKYELLAGNLSSKKTEDGILIKRNISGRRFTINFNNRYSISAGDQIIYTGENRQLSIRYLNPFLPYFLTGLEDQEKDSRFDNDNSMLFFHQRYMLSKGSSSIFNEFIIDDYQIDESGLQHAVGMKIGYDNILKIKSYNFLLVLEYTKISPLTYRHHGQFTSWQNLEHNIGFPFGGDIESFQFKIYAKNIKNKMMNLEIDYFFKGSSNTNSSWEWNDILYNKNESYKKYIFIKAGLTFIKKWGFIEIALKPINQLNSMIFDYNKLNKKNEITLNIVYRMEKSINIFKL